MIQATSNEDSTKLARVKSLIPNLRVADKPLPADYVITGNGRLVAVEIKWSVSDLLSSLPKIGEHGGPRLAVQARKMLSFADFPILLIPQLRQRGDGKVLMGFGGTGHEEKASGWEYLQVKGILADLALYGIIVDEWDGDLARRLAQWYYALTSKGHGWIKQLGRPNFVALDSTYREAVWCLCSFRGIGPRAAEELLRTFGSVARVAELELEHLQSIKGFGPKTAGALYEGLHREW